MKGNSCVVRVQIRDIVARQTLKRTIKPLHGLPAVRFVDLLIGKNS